MEAISLASPAAADNDAAHSTLREERAIRQKRGQIPTQWGPGIEAELVSLSCCPTDCVQVVPVWLIQAELSREGQDLIAFWLFQHSSPIQAELSREGQDLITFWWFQHGSSRFYYSELGPDMIVFRWFQLNQAHQGEGLIVFRKHQ